MRLVIAQARISRENRKGNATVFGAAPVFRWIVSIGLTVIIVLMLHAIAREPTWVLAGGAVLVVFVCFAWPGTFICADSGLIYSVWWRRSVFIPWREVAQVERTQGGDLNVYAAGGQQLCFTRFHIAPQRFEAEVLRRAQLPQAISSLSPTSLDV